MSGFPQVSCKELRCIWQSSHNKCNAAVIDIVQGGKCEQFKLRENTV